MLKTCGSWFHCKGLNILWRHFYGQQECRPWKIGVDLFFTTIFIYLFIFYEKPETKQPALRDKLRHFHGLSSDRP